MRCLQNLRRTRNHLWIEDDVSFKMQSLIGVTQWPMVKVGTSLVDCELIG